jgi:hypothetical protein
MRDRGKSFLLSIQLESVLFVRPGCLAQMSSTLSEGMHPFKGRNSSEETGWLRALHLAT